jgi:hypothetical protein
VGSEEGIENQIELGLLHEADDDDMTNEKYAPKGVECDYVPDPAAKEAEIDKPLNYRYDQPNRGSDGQSDKTVSSVAIGWRGTAVAVGKNPRYGRGDYCENEGDR